MNIEDELNQDDSHPNLEMGLFSSRFKENFYQQTQTTIPKSIEVQVNYKSKSSQSMNSTENMGISPVSPYEKWAKKCVQELNKNLNSDTCSARCLITFNQLHKHPIHDNSRLLSREEHNHIQNVTKAKSRRLNRNTQQFLNPKQFGIISTIDKKDFSQSHSPLQDRELEKQKNIQILMGIDRAKSILKQNPFKKH